MASPATRTRMRRPAPPAAAPEAPAASERFVWTRERYERLVDAGVLTTDDRVHLVDGEILAKMSQDTPHRTATLLTGELLRAAFSGSGFVQEEKPVALTDLSEPEPDLAVVRGRIRDFAAAHPTASDLLLLVEVAESSLGKDRTRMAALYAKADVPECWIVNLVERTVEVHRDPAGGAYRTKATYAAGDTVSPLHAADAAIPVADLLP